MAQTMAATSTTPEVSKERLARWAITAAYKVADFESSSGRSARRAELVMDVSSETVERVRGGTRRESRLTEVHWGRNHTIAAGNVQRNSSARARSYSEDVVGGKKGSQNVLWRYLIRLLGRHDENARVSLGGAGGLRRVSDERTIVNAGAMVKSKSKRCIKKTREQTKNKETNKRTTNKHATQQHHNNNNIEHIQRCRRNP